MATAVLPLLILGAIFVVGVTPISADELVPIFQARLFTTFTIVGHYDTQLINAVIPPVSQGIFVLVSQDGRAMSVYFPAMAILLTPFVWLGVPWLAGPLFGAFGLFLIGRLTNLLINRTAAVIAVVLTIASGQFLMTAMTPFPEGVQLGLSLLYVWLLLRDRPRDYLFAGLVGGFALALKNQFPHLLFALPWLIWLAVDRQRRHNLVPLALGYVPGLILIAGWLAIQNTLVTADLSAQGGFWLSKIAELVQVPSPYTITLRFLEVLSAWSWSAPGLLVLAAVAWFKTRDVRLKLLGMSFALTVVGYTLFPNQQGLGYGARYFHAAWAALPILAAAVLSAPGESLLRRYVLSAAVVGALVVLPVQLFYGHMLNDRRAEPIKALAAPGVNLYFVRFHGETGVSETVLADDLTGKSDIVLVSQGQSLDQRIVDRYFPGSRLVTTNSFGSGYERPP
jgi:hypothetical protein